MRTYVISSVLIILGLVCILWQSNLRADHGLRPYLSEISSAILVGGVLSVLYKMFEDKESKNDLRRLLRIHDSVDELGLTEILPEVQGYNFTPLISDSASLSIVMNDGLRWIGNNAVNLEQRFSNKTETIFLLVDPDSQFVKCLANKISTTEDDLGKKIRDAWQRIESAFNKSQKQGVVRIYRIRTYPTKSMFFTEKHLVETPYQTASGRASIPVYVYNKVARLDAPYFFAKQDIDAMIKEATLEREFKAGS